MGGQKDGLADSKLSRIDVGIDALDVADSSAVLRGQVEEEIAALDVVGLDQALRSWADWNVDQLAGEDEVDVLDLLVDIDEGVEGDVVVAGDVGESVTALDDVGRADGESAGSGGCWSGLGEAGGVVRGGAAGWDLQGLAWNDEVRVGDVVETGDVADAGVELGGEATESVACHSAVLNRGIGAAGQSDSWMKVSGYTLCDVMVSSYILLAAKP